MKPSITKKILIPSLITASLVAGGLAIAGSSGDYGKGYHKGMGKHGWHDFAGPGQFMKGMRGLDLSAEQKKAMIDIQENYKPQLKTLKTQMRESRMSVMQAMDNNGDLENAASQQATLVKDMILLSGQIRAEVYGILSEEQRATLNERKEKRKQKMLERMEKRS